MQGCCDPAFEEMMRPHFSKQELDAQPGAVFGLWSDYTLAYLNPAWQRFAAENEGQPEVASRWGLGAYFFDAIPHSLEPFYRELLEGAPEPGLELHPINHEYECSSPELYRVFHLLLYTLPKRQGYLFVNSLVVERPHDPDERPPHAPHEQEYRNEDGMATQCSHCRRFQRPGDAEQWDWVPEWVKDNPPKTSHGICPICSDYYYAELEADQEPLGKLQR
jgi:hypothetical protein